MSFNNSKENVYDLQLTQYGKYLYSKGKLKPAYYAFFDDEILYDGLFANVVENKNNIEARIQEETAYTNCLYVTKGIETNLNTPYTLQEDNSYSDEDLCNLQFPIGSSDLYNSAAPSWNFKILKGQIYSFTPYVSSSNKIIQIPQIDTKVIYNLNKTKVEVTPEFKVEGLLNSSQLTEEQIILIESSFGGSENPQIKGIEDSLVLDGNYNNINITKVFSDGTVVYSEEQSVIFDIQELNTQLIDDLFEIEVYRKDKDSESNNVWKQLKFFNKPSQVINNVLVEHPQSNMELTNEYVEYYFNMFSDTEINDQFVCDYISPTLSGENTVVNVVRCNGTSKKQTVNELYIKNSNNGEIC